MNEVFGVKSRVQGRTLPVIDHVKIIIETFLDSRDCVWTYEGVNILIVEIMILN